MQAVSTGVPAALTNIPEQGKEAHLRWTSLENSSRKQSLKCCQSKFESPLHRASRLLIQRLCKRLPMLPHKKGGAETQNNQMAVVRRQLDSLLVLLCFLFKIKTFTHGKKRKRQQKFSRRGLKASAAPKRRKGEGEFLCLPAVSKWSPDASKYSRSL